MALLPIDQQSESQETMFDEPARLSGLEPYETAEEASDESPEYPAASAQTMSPAESPSVPAILTVDDFAALEERVLRAVNLVRGERQARVAAEERLAALETRLQSQLPAIESLQQEVGSLRLEREQVRQRVERLLSQL